MKKLFVFKSFGKIHVVKAISVASDVEILFTGDVWDIIPEDIQSQIDAYVDPDEYKEKRKKEYPSAADQLDVIFKQFSYMKANGESLVKECDDLLKNIVSIKNKYPKP